MSARNAYCCLNSGNYLSHNPCRRTPWYCKLVKPFAFFMITAMLAMSVSHLCDKYSASQSLRTIKFELENLRQHLITLSEAKSELETRDDLESKLKELGYVIPKISEAILKLRSEVSEEMGLLKTLSPDNVRDMVRSELQTYDADKTGRTDYALETSGGKILSTRDSETYTAGAPVLSLFGVPLCSQQNTPRAIIQTGVLPGECWAFKGSTGSVVIQLLGFVLISGVSLEHISPSISPTGETTSAPRDFSIWGLNSVEDCEGFSFGRFTYNNSDTPVQYFQVQNAAQQAYKIVELKIHSNSGNKGYTCIYRIRVHGSLSR